MRTRPFGKTGLDVSAVGFGVSGALATPLISNSDVTRLVHAAVDMGINLFDTGPSYGDGTAEERLGTALEGVNRNKYILSTKVGTFVGRLGRLQKDFSAKAIEESVHQSLRRLKAEHIDVLFLHGPDAIYDETYRALQDLKISGKVGFVGVCGNGAELDEPIRNGQFDAMMMPFHMLSERPHRSRIQEASVRDLGILGFQSLAPLGELEEPKPVSKLSDLFYKAKAWLKPPEPLKRKGPLDFLEKHAGWTPAQLCLGYALSEPGLSSVLVNTTRLEHLKDCAAVVDRDLPQNLGAQVEMARFS